MFELVLEDLKALSREGPVPAVGSGSNAVGMTLQERLGIVHTTNGNPSHKGFVLKSTTASPTGTGRMNLFARVASWQDSELCSSRELLELLGRPDEARGYELSLFCTVGASRPNGFGLVLGIDRGNSMVVEYLAPKAGAPRPLLRWNVSDLKKRLIDAKPYISVTAERIQRNGRNYFHYRFAEYLGEPDSSRFEELVEDGVITLDHLLSLKPKKGVREQGPLFKLALAHRHLLYPDARRTDLLL